MESQMTKTIEDTLHTKQKELTHLDAGEAPFAIDETFFSLTDLRGVIRAGNETFARVSGFEWDDLIGAPHKIVRHPDMPKGVFYYMWDRLKRRLPVGAYVKNRTKDGRFYWVIAFVTPLADGYLSVRCKPTSAMLGRVKDLYAKMLRAEKNDGLSPQASCENLLREVRHLGFRNYSAFMAEALNMELTLRNEALGVRVSHTLPILSKILQAGHEIDELGREMLRSYKAITVAPTNLQVRASRLGDLGQALASISANFTTLTTEMTGKMNTFSELSHEVVEAVDQNRINTLSRHLISDAIMGFEAEETSLDPGAKERAMIQFKTELVKYGELTKDSTAVVRQNLIQFEKIVQEVRQLLSGLSVMRTMSQMEAARLVDEDPSIEMIVNDLRVFHDEALMRLDQIQGKLRTCQKHLAQLMEISRLIAEGKLEGRSSAALKEAIGDDSALAGAGPEAQVAEHSGVAA